MSSPLLPQNLQLHKKQTPFTRFSSSARDPITAHATEPSPSSGLYSTKVYDLSAENVNLVLDDVRLYLIADGGNVVVVSGEDGVISLQLQGACGSCPSSTTTMKMGIKMLKEKFGEAVKDISQVYDDPQNALTTVEALNAHLDITELPLKTMVEV